MQNIYLVLVHFVIVAQLFSIFNNFDKYQFFLIYLFHFVLLILVLTSLDAWNFMFILTGISIT